MWDLSGNELTRNSSVNTRSQSSQLAEPPRTDPGLKSGISVRELISTLKKRAQAWNELSNILPKFSQTKKLPPPPQVRSDVWRFSGFRKRSYAWHVPDLNNNDNNNNNDNDNNDNNVHTTP